MSKARITQLSFYPGNARRGDIDLVAESLKINGQYKPIVVNKGTHAPDLENTILAGNHTCMAAQRLGWRDIDVHWVDVDTDTARRIVLVDNASNDKATYDLPELTELLGDGPLTGTGFTQEELDAMLETLDEQADEATEETNTTDMSEDYSLTIECDTAGQRDSLKARLVAEGFIVN